MPWRLVGALVVAGLVPCMTVAHLMGAAYVAPLLAGLIVGTGATMVGSARRAIIGGALVLIMLGLHMVWPATDLRLFALCFALAAGWETARTGGRALPMTLMAAGILWSGFQHQIPHTTGMALFAPGLVWGLLVAWALGLASFPKLPPEGDRAGLRQSLFLGCGLLLSITAVQHWPAAHAIWIVQMFILRATAPTRLTSHQAVRFVLGAMAGVCLALIVEYSGLSAPPLGYVIATVALVIGLRLMPLGPPLATIPMTVAVLLALAPTPAEAVFRSEAALAATLLAIALSFAADRLLGLHHQTR